MKGLILFLVFAIVVIAILYFFKRTGARNTSDRSAWHVEERNAFDILKERLESGDLTQEEYEQKKREIENKL